MLLPHVSAASRDEPTFVSMNNSVDWDPDRVSRWPSLAVISLVAKAIMKVENHLSLEFGEETWPSKWTIVHFHVRIDGS